MKKKIHIFFLLLCKETKAVCDYSVMERSCYIYIGDFIDIKTTSIHQLKQSYIKITTKQPTRRGEKKKDL